LTNVAEDILIGQIPASLGQRHYAMAQIFELGQRKLAANSIPYHFAPAPTCALGHAGDQEFQSRIVMAEVFM